MPSTASLHGKFAAALLVVTCYFKSQILIALVEKPKRAPPFLSSVLTSQIVAPALLLLGYPK